MTPASEVWLFGSTARGDTDAVSDIDVLVAGEIDDGVLDRLPYPRQRLSLVRYDWAELRQMASYGSLFLHHVRIEGRPLQSAADSALGALLHELPPYERARYELASFVVVLADVEHAIDGDHSPAFELSVIATALRHSCILGCYAIGRPTFGRGTAFEVFLRHVGRESVIAPAQELYEFRLYEDQRGAAPFTATTEDVRMWLGLAREILSDVERALNAEA